MGDDRRASSLSIDVVELDGCTRVVAAGDVDLASAPALVDAVLAGLDGGGRVQLDLGAVTFLDSSGIHALMRLANAGAGASALTIGPELHPPVRRVLEVSGVLPMLPFGDA